MLQRPAMRKAVNARDLGMVYRLLLGQGYSLYQLSVFAGQTQAEAAAVVGGRLVVPEDHFFAICLDLGMWPTVLALGKGFDMERPAQSALDPEVERRRVEVARIDAGTVGANVVNEVPGGGRRVVVPDRLRAADVRQIETAARILRPGRRRYTDATKAAARAQVDWGQALMMAPATKPLRQRLQVAVRVLEAIAGEGRA